MTKSEIQKRRDRRIDLLYKNLEYVSSAYFEAESVFPFWEAAFALIVGQLVVGYFDPDICPHQQIKIAIIGMIVSSIWFILVSLNLKNAQHMEEQIIKLENQLNQELRGWVSTSLNPPLCEIVKPWAKGEKENWHWFGNILLGNEPHNKLTVKMRLKLIWDYLIWFLNEENIKKTIEELIYVSKSTWLWRRVLPFLLICSWSYLLIIC